MRPSRLRSALTVALRAGIVAGAIAASSAGAQQPGAAAASDSARAAAADTVRPRGPQRPRSAIAPRPGLEPPISPRRAFLSSLLVPGLGQSRLQRPSAGAGFFLVELGALTMLQKSLGDLREVKRLRADSVVSNWPVDPGTGALLPRPPRVLGAFGEELLRARRVHLEDWVAVLLFNHLVAGTEAYVAANLWDVPAQVSMRLTPSGARALVVAFAW